MTAAVHPLLGTIDSSTPGFWEATMSFADRDVVLDLTIEGTDLSPATLKDVLRRADDLAALDKLAAAAIRRDAKDGEDAAAGMYVHHHLEELPDAHLEQLFGTSDREQITPETLLSRLFIVRVGLYPESDDGQILIDYSLGADVTSYLLCVSFDDAGKPTAVDFES
jgi:hypothetical protein